MALFRALGPDLTVAAYAVNLVLGDGPNPDQAIMNEVNEAICRALSLEDGPPPEIPTCRCSLPLRCLTGRGRRP